MNSIQKQVEQTLFSAQVGHHICDERSVHLDRSAVASLISVYNPTKKGGGMTDLTIAIYLPLCDWHMGPCEWRINTRRDILITNADVWIEYVQTTRNSCLCDWPKWQKAKV